MFSPTLGQLPHPLGRTACNTPENLRAVPPRVCVADRRHDVFVLDQRCDGHTDPQALGTTLATGARVNPMCDRIAVMNDGFVQQVVTPIDLYERPTNLFVAGSRHRQHP